MLQVELLIDEFGEEATAEYLRQRFSKPENFFEFTAIASEYATATPPEFHRAVIDLIQGNSRVAIAAPRGGAKSTLVSFFYALWCALHTKYNHILIISDTYAQARLHVDEIKSEIESNEIIQWIYPGANGELTDDQWGQQGIVINGLSGKTLIKPLGSGMKVRGLKFRSKRPELVIIDDLENEEAVYSRERREKLQRWFNNALLASLDPSGQVVMIGTILHYHSLLKKITDRKEIYSAWTTQVFKALKDEQSFWPDRFTTDDLRRMRDDPTYEKFVGSISFAQEYQNEPQDDKDRIIKMDWIKSYTLNEELVRFEGDDDERLQKFLSSLEIIAGVDPAISEKETADYFAMYVYGFDKESGKEYMLDMIRERIGDINTQVKSVCDLVERWRISRLGIESIAYQSGLSNLVKQELQRRNAYYCKTVAIKTDKDKVRRARIHSQAFESNFVYLRSDNTHYDIVRSEIEEFPMGQHDDAFDALMLARESRSITRNKAYTSKPRGF